MKTKNLFRVLTAAAFLAVMSFGANAQLTTSTAPLVVETDPNQATDFVTIGSIMPYEVTPDATISALVAANPLVFSPSVFRWAVAGAATGALQLQAGGALTPAPAPDAATHVVQNQVAVHWTTTGAATLSVFEKSQNLAGLPACEDATAEDINIQVVALPTVVYNETDGTAGDNIMGGCGIAGTVVNLPVTVTGTDLWQMTYSVRHYDLTNTLVPADNIDATTASLGTSNLFVDGFANTENITMYALNVPAVTGYGKYEITVSSVTDRISRKSLNTPAQNPGTPTPATLVVWSLPTPSTGVIRKVSNLGW